MTWLQGQSFYTWLSAASSNETLFFTRTGANDPDFNLRSEAGLILRRDAKDSLFASVVETHGFFNESTEECRGATGKVHTVKVIGFNEDATVVEIIGDDIALTVMVNNRADVTEQSQMTVEFAGQSYSWMGNFLVEAAGV